jgi:hypothetical protein
VNPVPALSLNVTSGILLNIERWHQTLCTLDRNKDHDYFRLSSGIEV